MGWRWGKTFNIVVGMVFQMGCTFLVILWLPRPHVVAPFFKNVDLLAHPVVAATFSAPAAANLGEVLFPTDPTQPPHGRCAARLASPRPALRRFCWKLGGRNVRNVS